MSVTDQQVIEAAQTAEREQKLRKEIADILMDLRLEKGWTQREAAYHLGTSQQNIPRLEKGVQDLKLGTLQRFANAYGYGIEVNFIPLEEEV